MSEKLAELPFIEFIVIIEPMSCDCNNRPRRSHRKIICHRQLFFAWPLDMCITAMAGISFGCSP